MTPCNTCMKLNSCEIYNFLKNTKLDPWKIEERLFTDFGNVYLFSGKKEDNDNFVVDCGEYQMEAGTESYGGLLDKKAKQKSKCNSCKCGGKCK